MKNGRGYEIPPICCPVRWFPNAEPDERPEPAFIVNTADNGMCELITVRVGDGLRKRNVLHISDERLEEKPQFRKPGAWDYVEGLKPTVPQAPVQEAEDAE